MSNSVFGWDLPPGVSHRMIEEQYASGPCDVCGGNVDAGKCICPACIVCGAHGDPLCYRDHGLEVMDEQKKQRAECERQRDALDKQLDEAYAQMCKDQDTQWEDQA